MKRAKQIKRTFTHRVTLHPWQMRLIEMILKIGTDNARQIMWPRGTGKSTIMRQVCNVD